MPSYNIELNSKPNKGGSEYTLLLRITEDRKHARIKLEYAIPEKHYNPSPKNYKYVSKSHPKHVKINQEIDDKIQEAKDAAKALNKEKKAVTAASIKERMLQVNVSDAIKYTSTIIARMKENGQIGSSKKYYTLVNHLKNYTKKEELLFRDIDHLFLEKFQTFLKKIGMNQTSSSKYLETLRTVYRKASNEGVTDQLTNPFQNFKIQRGQVKKDRLTEEEIQAIIELKLEEGSLIWHVRNSFLFSFYCAGIRASDILQLKWKNIIDGRLVYKMQKTNRPHTMKLHDKAKAILDYYGPRDPENFVFSYLDNNVDYSDPEFAFNQLNSKTVLLNKYLGKIAKMSEIEKRVTTHTARHSFADIARQKTDNLYNLSKTLGHSSIKITEAYLASFDEKAVDDTLDEVFK